MMMEAIYSRKEFAKLEEEFRISAIVADGMWWSIEKWARQAKVSEDTLRQWIAEHMATGELVQSATGARSYRFPLESIKAWYARNRFPIDTQLVDFLFPPRIWDGVSEVEGFMEAPLRELGTVKFTCSSKVAEDVKKALHGIARIREHQPGEYRAYSLSSGYVKEIITGIFKKYNPSEVGTTHSRLSVYRRELVDFTPAFANGLVSFYQNFGRTLAKGAMETIKIYLPDREDQNSQITYWVILAIEKFDEKSSVPFSGYLNSVLMLWPYDLPHDYLGKDLAQFQRQRAKAVKRLKADRETEDPVFTHQELADSIGIPLYDFSDLESKHRAWIGARTATTLTWDQTSDEKLVKENVTGGFDQNTAPSDMELAHRLSVAIVEAAVATRLYDDAFSLITQVDANSLDYDKIRNSSPGFIKALGEELGMEDSA